MRNLCETFNGIIYITSSEKSEGEELFDTLKKEGLTTILRIANLASEKDIKEVHDEIKKKHGGVDIVLTNCKRQFSKPSSISFPQAERYLEENFYNIVSFMKVFFPLVRSHGRIVLCTTQPGVYYGREFLRDAPNDQRDIFSGADITMSRLKHGVENYLASVKEDQAWTLQVDSITSIAT